jgi:hypothetical protein
MARRDREKSAGLLRLKNLVAGGKRDDPQQWH